jgi:alditol oxidase
MIETTRNNRAGKNWAGNIEYSAANFHEPTSVDELAALVAKLDRLRVLGTRHSFNTIADSDANLISLARLPPRIEIDIAGQTVTVGVNVPYGMLTRHLHQHGFALHNLGSLPHISVIGACATATHGSGVGNRNLTSAVSSMTLIRADGETITISRAKDPDVFNGAAVHMGALGVVTHVTLDILPTYTMRQTVYEHLQLSRLAQDFDAIIGGGYSVSLFTTWEDDMIDQVWLKEVVDESSSVESDTVYFGARAATHPLHPIRTVSPENCTTQLGIPGTWYERLPHFRYDAVPSVGDELQSEYFVARADAPAALDALYAIRDSIAPCLLISEIRAVASDEFWMSPCYGRDSIALHFTWKPDWQAVRDLLPKLEAALAPFAPRPHWGKLFSFLSSSPLQGSPSPVPAALRSTYPRYEDFVELANKYDPGGKFRNPFLNWALFTG